MGLMASAVLCASASCSTAQYDRAPCALCEEPSRYVRLQDAPRLGIGEGFSHPFQLTSQEWAILLRSIQVQPLERPLLAPAIKGAVQEAFTEEDVTYLSETLSRACADASAQEWVVFVLTRARQPGLDEMTSGAWYAQGDQIHLRLSNYRIAVALPSIRKVVWQQPTRQHATAVYDVVPGEHQRLRIDREGRNPFTNDPIDLAMDYRQIIVLPQASSNRVNSTESLPVPSLSTSIEDRLKTLNQLREKGLITEDEYRTKRQQILEEL